MSYLIGKKLLFNKNIYIFNFKKLACLLLCLLTFIPSSLVWAQGSPGEVIIYTIEQGLEILQDSSLQALDKMSERRQKLWGTIGPIFNFEEISKRALGRHWKDRTAEERKEFTQLFTKFLKNLYLSKSDTYAGEKLIYLQENIEGNHSKVQTNLLTTDGKKIALDFNLHKINNTWKIYDMIIEGVSVVGNYRSQFNSILHKSSFAELIKKLKEKEFTQSDI